MECADRIKVIRLGKVVGEITPKKPVLKDWHHDGWSRCGIKNSEET
jgi:hypothetical protein